MFKVQVHSHDKNGEMYSVDILTAANKDRVDFLLSVLGWKIRNIYAYTIKRRGLPLSPDEILKLEAAYGIRLGEFRYEPILFISRI